MPGLNIGIFFGGSYKSPGKTVASKIFVTLHLEIKFKII